MNGRERIEAERQRQKDVHGFTAEHDADHTDGSLFDVAACYAGLAISQTSLEMLGQPTIHPGDRNRTPKGWPSSWSVNYWRPDADPARNWEKAGALFLAEFDREKLAGATDDGDHSRLLELEAYVSCCADELDRREAGLPSAKRYLGVMVVAAVPHAVEGVPGYDVLYPNGTLDWSPADLFDKHCFELGDTDEMTPKAAWRFRPIVSGLDLSDELAATVSILDALMDWGKQGYGHLTLPADAPASDDVPTNLTVNSPKEQ